MKNRAYQLLTENCAVPTKPLPIKQPLAHTAPSPIRKLPMIDLIRVLIFTLTIENSSLKNEVKNEPTIIPTMKSFDQPIPSVSSIITHPPATAGSPVI